MHGGTTTSMNVALLTTLLIGLVTVLIPQVHGSTSSGNGEGSTQIHKVLVLSYEFVDPVFSGNGVLSRTIVRSLKRLGISTVTISARPKDVPEAESLRSLSDLLQEEKAHPWAQHQVITIPVDPWNWYKLDHTSGWEQYAATAWKQDSRVFQFLRRTLLKKQRQQAEVAPNGESIPSHRVSPFDAVIAVDWHGALLLAALEKEFPFAMASIPSKVYMNFRVFSQSVELHSNTSVRDFFRLVESSASSMANKVIALSKRDAYYLETMSHRMGHSGDTNTAKDLLSTKLKHIQQSFQGLQENSDKVHSYQSRTNYGVLMPPLRTDLDATKQGDPQDDPLEIVKKVCPDHQSRCLVTCCVRLSPEKRSQECVETVNAMRGFMTQSSLRPLLCAPGREEDRSDYAKQTIQTLQSVWGDDAIIIRHFVPPSRLKEIFNRTILNLHPPTSDAFGMTVAESAYFGAPSVVHSPVVETRKMLKCAQAENKIEKFAGAIFPLNASLLDGPTDHLPQEAPTVGVAELLKPECNESFGVDWSASPESVADQILSRLEQNKSHTVETLETRGSKAKEKVDQWTLPHFDESLSHILHYP
eukprot:gb/GECG01010792.1/.p1 GENE.gb/GECG01010792.1/~~gb/GECG01010792.1/.p1  ORF type:complete len:586 (+),score=61.54 gb/GECG01010792.1/:1-1758(+)